MTADGPANLITSFAKVVGASSRHYGVSL